jgi:hypothetical protein
MMGPLSVMIGRDPKGNRCDLIGGVISTLSWRERTIVIGPEYGTLQKQFLLMRHIDVAGKVRERERRKRR